MSVIPEQVVADFAARGCAPAKRKEATITYANGETETRAPVLVEIELIDDTERRWRTQIDRAECEKGLLALPSKQHILVGMDILSLMRIQIDGPSACGFLEI